MKKIYSIIGLVALAFTVNAQNQRTALKSALSVSGSPVNGVTTSTTTVIMPPSVATCTLSMYTAGPDGYVAGTNSFDDKEKAQRLDLTTYSLTTPASVSAAAAYVGYVTDAGVGSTVTAKIYSDASGTPGTLLGTSVAVPLSAITSNTINAFPFMTPVNLTGNVFYVSIDISGLNSSAGDTLAIVQTEDGCAANGSMTAWEKWDDDSWNDIESVWTFTSTDLVILAQVTADIVTGVKNNTLDASVAVSPNPSNGVFNVAVKSTNLQNVTVNVTNTIGQSVLSKNFNLSSENISFDLSEQSNGVYFVTISNGTDTTVKKVVLNK